MLILLGIALKSLLIAGSTLALLTMMKRRSAAERSWVAHIGLVALVLLAVAPLVLPSWRIEAPALLGQAPSVQTLPQTATPVVPSADADKAGKVAAPVKPEAPVAASAQHTSLGTIAAATAIYAVPAAILLFITFLALARLIALRARAEVLVDGHWLSALARAQRRMGFKHGTALLTSDELASPISWGLMRPVILLNNRAVEAQGEAEAIIAHELAHVARMDWIKLLLARVATALFWFNPFVWMLAREAHQLREEAADDAVLAADIPDTDYAELLVGVARHECPGLLLGAHGVAPSRSSLARRVARVLDGASVRGPAARSFAAGVFVGAVAIAAPLAAITLTPKGAVTNAKVATASKQAAAQSTTSTEYYPDNNVPTDLPSIIGEGVAASVEGAVAAVRPSVQIGPNPGDFETISSNGSSVRSSNGVTVARSQNGATVTVYPVDAQGRRKVVARAPNGATAISYADADDDIPGFGPDHAHKGKDKDDAIEQAVQMRALGVNPQYMAALRAAAPKLRDADEDDFIQLKAVGVTPEYVRDLAAAGFSNLDADELTQARALRLTGDYIRRQRAAGYDGDLDDFIELKATTPPTPPNPPRPPGG